MAGWKEKTPLLQLAQTIEGAVKIFTGSRKHSTKSRSLRSSTPVPTEGRFQRVTSSIRFVE
jgi:hypothetical protein